MNKRYIRFFWYSLFGFIFAFVTVRIWHEGNYSVTEIFDALSGDIWEVLLVKMNGINRGKDLLNVPAWAMSCMLFAEFFVLGVNTYWEQIFLTFLMPVSIFIGVGYWMNMNYVTYKMFLNFLTFGMLRVYLLICLGIADYWISQRIRMIKFSNAGRWVVTAAELLGYICCVLITLFQNSRNYQFCFILFATFVLAISFSQQIVLLTSV